MAKCSLKENFESHTTTRSLIEFVRGILTPFRIYVGFSNKYARYEVQTVYITKCKKKKNSVPSNIFKSIFLYAHFNWFYSDQFLQLLCVQNENVIFHPKNGLGR